VKRRAEKGWEEIGNDGKDHQGLPIQIANALQKCWEVELGTNKQRTDEDLSSKST